MKKDIILAGVGGQGILSIAATIGTAAIELNLQLKQAEVHGMSQRGGDVQSHLRLSSEDIASDLIPEGKADLIISIEPMESLRYLPFDNIPNYPDRDLIMDKIKSIPNHIIIDADAIATEIGSARSANIVILGASAPFLDIEASKLENAIRTIFSSKGEEVVNLNLEAFRAGLNFSLSNK